MKKILSLLAAAFLMGSLNAHAQLGDLLGSLSKVVYAYTGNTEAVDLPGTWTYQGPALALGSDSALANVTGAALGATAEKKVAGYLEKFGFKAGSVQFTFQEDLTFTCTVRGVPLSGTPPHFIIYHRSLIRLFSCFSDYPLLY